MHPTTAFDFTLVALSLILLATGRWYRTAQAIALFAGVLAASVLTGYAYGVRQFIGVMVFNQMALHTAIGMLAATAGILLRVETGA